MPDQGGGPGAVPRPDGYDAGRYALLLRLLEAGYTGPFFNAVSVGRPARGLAADELRTGGDRSLRELIAAHRCTVRLMWCLAKTAGVGECR